MKKVHTTNRRLQSIAEKVVSNQRITEEEGLILYQEGELGYLGLLSSHARRQKHGDNAYFIRNIHIEPSNVCIYNCQFCSFSSKQSNVSWDYSVDDIIESLKRYDNQQIKEIHITGSVNPKRDIEYYTELIKAVRFKYPKIIIKAFSAVEINYLSQKSQLTYKEVLRKLLEAGLNALPGGGAEIFDETLREIISPDKVKSEEWLKIHEEAHALNIKTNSTMLYGHIENYEHRIDHLSRLRKLQDKTGGFGAFIPLKFRNKNNYMSSVKECTVIEDLRNFAVSRIFLDNFPHIKSYWPMLGKQFAQLSMNFGVDDIDGTIEDTTKIYSLAGAEDKHPTMTAEDMKQLITEAGFVAVER